MKMPVRPTAVERRLGDRNWHRLRDDTSLAIPLLQSSSPSARGTFGDYETRTPNHSGFLAGFILGLGDYFLVRNPLSVIRSSAQMLAEDAPMQDEEILNYITTEVDRLDAFVARVMDFSRPLDADLKVVNWKDLQQRLGRVVGEDVRFSGDATQFELDPDLTVQLLANLVENAQKSHAKQIEVRAQGSAIDVVDDGEGVCDEVRDQLFEPFVTSRAKGTGLGLAVARKLARVQGWELELAEGGLAPDGGGARFRLRQANT